MADTYTVKKGDSLSKIAAALGIDDWRDLYNANESVIGSDPNVIKPGQVLTLPGASEDGDEPAGPDEAKTGITDEQQEVITEVMGGDPEIWFDTTKQLYYLVYFVPDTDVPLLYEATDENMEALFPDGDIRADKNTTTALITEVGGIYAGTADDPYGDPYATFIEMMEKEAIIRPWLKEPDMLAVMFEAALEGRQVTEGELMNTEWWRTHSEAERQWLITLNADPLTAESLITDALLNTRNLLESAGVNNASDALVDFMAMQFVTGAWSEVVWGDQIRALADPSSGSEMLPELAEVIANEDEALDTTHTYEEKVRAEVVKWLGPVHGDWTDAQIADWAGKLRNNPDGAGDLTAYLRGQRLAIFPEYENENLSYQDISGSWKTLWSNTWGSDANEVDPLFDQLMRSPSYTDGVGLLRSEGLARGNESVMNDLEASVASTGRKTRSTF